MIICVYLSAYIYVGLITPHNKVLYLLTYLHNSEVVTVFSLYLTCYFIIFQCNVEFLFPCICLRAVVIGDFTDKDFQKL